MQCGSAVAIRPGCPAQRRLLRIRRAATLQCRGAWDSRGEQRRYRPICRRPRIQLQSRGREGALANLLVLIFSHIAGRDDLENLHAKGVLKRAKCC